MKAEIVEGAESNPILLPDIFSSGPGVPVDLGSAKADFWIEDNCGKQLWEIKQTDVKGTQIIHPKGQIQLTISNIPGVIIKASITGKSFIKFVGYDPIQCLNQTNNEKLSTWSPLRVPLDIQYSTAYGSQIEFVLFGFPVFFGEQDITIEKTDRNQTATGWWRCGQIVLSHGKWLVQISAHDKTKEWNEAIKHSGGLAATHAGRIKKQNNEIISWNEAQNIINCLHHFLSFARGHWQPLGHVRLLANDGVCLHERWGILRGDDQFTQSSLTWWSHHPHANQLSDVFKGFWELWNDSLWKDTLPELIYWYLQANLAGKGHIGAGSALILSQSTLEKLSWVYTTQIRKAVSEEAFQPGKLKASDQMRLLATLLDLPQEIPDILDSIKEDVKGQKFEDAFHAITVIRNQVVHSKKKRELKPMAEFDAWNLSQWYVEMCLLRLMQYQGQYANRVRLKKWAGETDSVPWAKANKENV